MKKLFSYMSKIWLLTLSLLLIISIFTINTFSMTLTYDGHTYKYNEAEIRLIVNGMELTGLPLPPVNLSGRVYVPAREVFEAIGAVVDWKAESSQVFIGYNDILIVLQIDNLDVNVNGMIYQIPVPPKNINNKTMIPVRFAAELLGFIVDWDDKERIVYISENIVDIPPEPTVPPNPEPTAQPDNTNAVNNDNYIEKPEDAVDISTIFSPESLDLANDISTGVFTIEEFPETKITDIVVASGGDGYTYKILANTAISRVDKVLLKDNRLYLDIYNAEMALAQTTYIINGNPFLSQIRAAQNQMMPIKVSRIVFEITNAVNYSISLSPDRKEITVSFEKNYITNISFQTDGTSDYIIIEGLMTPVASLFPLPSPDRLVINLPLSIMLAETEINVNGIFAQKIRTGQFEPETARVVIDLKDNPSYSVSSNGNKTVIKLSNPTYRNVSFSSERMVLSIPKSADFAIDINSIIHEDRYEIYKYSMILPGDYSHYLGQGVQLVKDNYVNSIDIQTINGKTIITFNENQILAFVVKEDSDNIYFQAMLPKEKYSNIIVLDPGHGASDPGTEGFGMLEKDVNLDVSLRLIALLEADPLVKVYATRKTDIYPSFNDRVNLGNTIGDLYISLHHNAFTSSKANGTETFYHEHTLSVYNFSSKQVADIIQKNLLQDLGLFDRKAKPWDYYVIKYTTIPSVLVEVGFLTNADDAAKIATSDFRQRTAESLYRSIKEIFSVYNPPR